MRRKVVVVPEKIHARLKAYCGAHALYMEEAAAEALERWLARREKRKPRKKK